jgi:tetrahydromethanopterin S-methyltransferase subunit G/biotin operon repressor
MSQIFAFVDEFGTNSFNFEKQSTHFIIAAVICKSENLEKIQDGINNIRKKHKFQKGELKSSKVGKNHNRRIRILKDIINLDFYIYSVVVDKQKLKGQGFKYKESFYKFLNNLLYKELYRTFPNLKLCVDEYGGNDYMLSFKKYVMKRHKPTLFSGSEFDILNSKKSNLIQLADFIAGTLGYIYDEKKKNTQSKEFLDIIKPKVSDISFFPKDFSFKDIEESNTDESFDPKIVKLSLLRINTFIHNTKGDTQEEKDQIAFLKLLILFQRIYLKNRYTSTEEIIRHLNRNRQDKINQNYFRREVIGKLRDKGILIASSSNGYKIPINKNDLESFVNIGRRIILPMLKRIETARAAIKLATNNELDLLDNFEELKEILK